MHTKYIFKVPCIIFIFFMHLLNGSDTHSASSENSSSSTHNKDGKKGFWHIATHAVAKITATTQPAFAIYAVTSLATLASMYGGYQLWRKFIFDSQLRSVQQVLSDQSRRSTQALHEDIKQAKQDINTHLAQEIILSEQRQMLHVTEQLQLLKTDFQHRLDASEQKVIDYMTRNSNTTDTIINGVKEQQKNLSEQINNNHQELVRHFERRPLMLGLPIINPQLFKKKLPVVAANREHLRS